MMSVGKLSVCALMTVWSFSIAEAAAGITIGNADLMQQQNVLMVPSLPLNLAQQESETVGPGINFRSDDVQPVSELKGAADTMSFVGSKANFTCVSPLKNCVGMTWHKATPASAARVPIYSECKGATPNGKYTVEDTDEGCKLVVEKVELTDTGSVICEIRVGNKKLEGEARLVAINSAKPESPLKGPNNSLAYIGSNAAFVCISPLGDCTGMAWSKYKPGSNPVQISGPDMGVLRKDKYTVGNSTEGCELTVLNVEMKDAGFITCEIVIEGKAFQGSAVLSAVTKD